MSEMAQTADHIIVLGRGRVIADAPVGEILALASGTAVRVRTPQAERFTELLRASGDAQVTSSEPGLLEVAGLTAPRIGELAAAEGIVLHELSPLSGSLEDAYLALTQDEVEYHAGGMEIS
jgi:ABC-2 type transport system ATP-binding protein